MQPLGIATTIFMITGTLVIPLASVYWMSIDEFSRFEAGVCLFLHFCLITDLFLLYYADRLKKLIAFFWLLLNFFTLFLECARFNLEIGLLINGERVIFFSDAFYFTIVTFTTLGFGDMIPSQALRPIVAMQVAIGYITLGLVVSSISHFMSEKQRDSMDISAEPERPEID